MTTDTDALLATVREVLRYWPDTEDGTRAEAALDSLAAELERLREKPDQPTLNAARCLLNATDNAERNAALGDLYNELEVEAMAELERLRKKERDWDNHRTQIITRLADHERLCARLQDRLRERDDQKGELEAELERVKAERDRVNLASQESARWAMAQSARLDKALSALREIAEAKDWGDRDFENAQLIARAALAALEEALS